MLILHPLAERRRCKGGVMAQFDRIIREAECSKLTGVSRTTRYELEKKGSFPSRRNLGGRSVGWLLSEVMDWVQNRDRVNSGKAA